MNKCPECGKEYKDTYATYCEECLVALCVAGSEGNFQHNSSEDNAKKGTNGRGNYKYRWKIGENEFEGDKYFDNKSALFAHIKSCGGELLEILKVEATKKDGNKATSGKLEEDGGMKTFRYKWRVMEKETRGSKQCLNRNDLIAHIENCGGELIEILNIESGETLKHAKSYLSQTEVGSEMKSYMKECPNCGKTYDNTWGVCIECNTKLIDKLADKKILFNASNTVEGIKFTGDYSDYVRCRKCGRYGLISDRCCPHCGSACLEKARVGLGWGCGSTVLLILGIILLIPSIGASSFAIVGAFCMAYNRSRDKRQQIKNAIENDAREVIYDKIIGQDEDFKKLVHAAQLHFDMQQYTAALMVFKDARKLQGNTSEIDCGVANSLLKLGRFREAHEEIMNIFSKYGKLSKRTSGLIESYIQGIIKHEAKNNYSANFIKENMEKMKKDLKDECLRFLSYYYANDKTDHDYVFEIKTIKRYLQNNPEDVDIRAALVEMFYRSKQFEKAIREGEIFLKEQHQENVELFVAKSFFALSSEADKAIELYKKVLGKLSSDEKIQIAEFLGDLLVRRKEYDEAIDIYKGILKDNPELISLKYHLALTYRTVGRIDEHIECLQELLKCKLQDSGVEEEQILIVLTKAFMELNYFELAYKQLQGLVLNDDVMELLYDLGAACENNKNHEIASKCYQDIFGRDIRYKDVSQKLNRLKSQINGEKK